MNAAKLDTLEEYTVGEEDRVFRAANGWYWQPRGTSDCFGPFESREEATADYDET